MKTVFVCDRYRFLFVPIGKNASSTLKAELRQPRFAARSQRYDTLEAGIRRDYFAFTFLRHPVSRFLSAYQEISMRLEMPRADRSRFPFASMPEGSERFEAFLGQAEEHLWDPHIERQSDHLEGIRLDLMGRVETLQSDLAAVYDRLGMGALVSLPRRRSRAERVQVYDYRRHWVREADLSATALERIRRLYASDLELWRRVTAARWQPPTVRRTARALP